MRGLALLLMVFLMLPVLPAHAGNAPVDYVNLGATLLKDGYLQRARNVLEKADIQKRDFDFARYYTLKGILWHQLGYPNLSNIFFDASIEKGQNNTSIYLYIARNHWQLHNYQQVITALDQAGEAASGSEQMFVIKAESYKQLDQMEKAWQVLNEGISLFPDYAKFYSQKFYYLVELGFFQRAVEYAEAFLDKQNHSAKDYLAISFALRESGQYEAAITLLEEAVLKNPGDTQLIELLGQVYIDQQHYTAAALVFDWASIEHPQFAYKAATLYLKTRQPVRSLQLNRRIINQEEKFRQRVGIDIQLEDYESLVTKTAALKRYELLDNDDIKYAVGYAFFRNGQYNYARTYLKQINDPEIFRKASYLFQQMEKCQDDPFECY